MFGLTISLIDNLAEQVFVSVKLSVAIFEPIIGGLLATCYVLLCWFKFVICFLTKTFCGILAWK